MYILSYILFSCIKILYYFHVFLNLHGREKCTILFRLHCHSMFVTGVSKAYLFKDFTDSKIDQILIYILGMFLKNFKYLFMHYFSIGITISILVFKY